MPPLVGGMERLNSRLVETLAARFRVALVGPEGCGQHCHTAEKICEARSRSVAGFLWKAGYQATRLIRGRDLVWVIAGSGLTAPLAWVVARLSGAKQATYVHGLDLVAPSRIYQWF